MACRQALSDHGIYRKYSGQVSGREIIDIMQHTHAMLNFGYLRYVISDFLEVEAFEISPYEIEYMAGIDNAASAINPDIRIAIVARDETLLSLAGRYAESSAAFNSPYETRVFHALDDAYLWLGVGDAVAID